MSDIIRRIDLASGPDNHSAYVRLEISRLRISLQVYGPHAEERAMRYARLIHESECDSVAIDLDEPAQSAAWVTR